MLEVERLPADRYGAIPIIMSPIFVFFSNLLLEYFATLQRRLCFDIAPLQLRMYFGLAPAQLRRSYGPGALLTRKTSQDQGR
jgi:hypothetical protein